jgi:hypothetical protein
LLLLLKGTAFAESPVPLSVELSCKEDLGI